MKHAAAEHWASRSRPLNIIFVEFILIVACVFMAFLAAWHREFEQTTTVLRTRSGTSIARDMQIRIATACKLQLITLARAAEQLTFGATSPTPSDPPFSDIDPLIVQPAEPIAPDHGWWTFAVELARLDVAYAVGDWYALFALYDRTVLLRGVYPNDAYKRVAQAMAEMTGTEWRQDRLDWLM